MAAGLVLENLLSHVVWCTERNEGTKLGMGFLKAHSTPQWDAFSNKAISIPISHTSKSLSNSALMTKHSNYDPTGAILIQTTTYPLSTPSSICIRSPYFSIMSVISVIVSTINIPTVRSSVCPIIRPCMVSLLPRALISIKNYSLSYTLILKNAF